MTSDTPCEKNVILGILKPIFTENEIEGLHNYQEGDQPQDPQHLEHR